ncbi:MAG: hypothetical protein AAGJ87_01425, partial [Pseudomonadota bacterium]
ALLAPFKRVASEAQQKMAREMWSNVGEWGDHANQPATPDVIAFIAAASKAQAEAASIDQSPESSKRLKEGL